MKQIKGKRYYVSLGYVDEEKLKESVADAKDITSIYMESKDNTVMYLDDSDKDNVIALPLVPVNEIQRKGDKFHFRLIVDPFKMVYAEGQKSHKINTIGLFAVYEKDGTQYVQHIAFYQQKTVTVLRGEIPTTYSIQADVDKILGE